MTDPASEDARVLVLGLGWFPDQAGGANRYVRELVEHSGPATAAVVIGPAADAPARVRAVSNHDAPLLTRLIAYTRAALSSARAADVVDAHFALYAFAPVLLGIARGRRLIVHFHGPWADEAVRTGSRSRLAEAARRFVERTVYRRASAVITLSTAFAELVVNRYGVDPGRVHVIPPGVDTVRFTPGDRTQARANLGLPAAGWLVVTARRLVPRSGVDVLVRAAAELAGDPERAAPITVVVAGAGPELGALQALAAELGAPVRFLGETSDAALVDLYRAADVAVVPSRVLEGFGLVVLEALACGTPVVVSAVDGLTEAVAGLPGDVIVQPGDESALAARLRAARNGAQPLPGAAECRAHAERFPWSAVVAAQRALANSPLRVVFVDHTATRSGGEIAMVRLIAALQPGVAAHVILLVDGPIAEDLRAVGATVEVVSMPESIRGLSRDRVRPTAMPFGAVVASGATSVALARRLRALRPDLVHANSLKAGVLAGPAARAAGVPLVWSVRDRLADDYLPNSAATLARGFARVFPAVVIANSETTRGTTGTIGTTAKVVTIADPYDAPDPPAARVPHDGIRVVMIGRIAPWKGQDVVLDAFAAAFPDGDELLTLVGVALFGEDEFERSLPDRASALGVADRVTFAGFVEDVPGVLAGADIAVHASVIPEPHGQVVVEAMAAGVPVIAAAAGGPAEIVTDGVDGLLVPPGDVDALALALQRLAADAALRAELSAAGRRRAADYRGAVLAPRVMAAYHSVLSERR